MWRSIMAVLVGLACLSSSALANGPGGFGARVGFNAKWGPGSPHNGQGQPGLLGPWYLYWPLEAHFITPAHPQYPYWPSPQTLPGGASAVTNPVYGPYAAPPNYPPPQYYPPYYGFGAPSYSGYSHSPSNNSTNTPNNDSNAHPSKQTNPRGTSTPNR